MFYYDSFDLFLQDFITARNDVALDIGVGKNAPLNSVCEACKGPVQGICVSAPRMGKMVWHPACFKCHKCDDLLVDLAYCAYEGDIYCERDYAELLKPRCAACDEVSFFKFMYI